MARLRWNGNIKAMEMAERSAEKLKSKRSKVKHHGKRKVRSKRGRIKRRPVGFRERTATEDWWDWYNAYLRSPAWKERRRICFENAGWKCNRCGTTKKLTAHHRTYARVGRERQKDLECLCEGCHSAHHDQEPKNLPEELRMPDF
jgi:5-methylcytosine-specific restriction endonuclease McrA